MAARSDPAQEDEGPPVHGVFEGEPMYSVIPPNAIPAITDPEFLTGAAADAQMSPEEPVIGASRGGDAVCWSTWQLDEHEIVNDTLDGSASTRPPLPPARIWHSMPRCKHPAT